MRCLITICTADLSASMVAKENFLAYISMPPKNNISKIILTSLCGCNFL